MALADVKSEHNGAKNGGGGYGTRAEVKTASAKLRREDAKAVVRASKVADYQPINPIATFTDEYGEERVIHRPHGNRHLRVYQGLNTVPLRLNYALAKMLGKNIRARRLELGLTLQQVALRAGLHNGGNPKNYMHNIEAAGNPGRRNHAIRLGTLYAIAFALECTPADLMPSSEAVFEEAGIGPNDFVGLVV